MREVSIKISMEKLEANRIGIEVGEKLLYTLKFKNKLKQIIARGRSVYLWS